MQRGTILYTGGIFFAVSGVGGLITLWAIHSVYLLSNVDSWAWLLFGLWGIGVFLFTSTHPSKLRRAESRRVHFP
ncbi:MAG: hypothetical protein V1776_01650 [Candidatus Diapherotrites archaeon]